MRGLEGKTERSVGMREHSREEVVCESKKGKIWFLFRCISFSTDLNPDVRLVLVGDGA